MGITWLSPSERYQIQLAILSYREQGVTLNFYQFISGYFLKLGWSTDFISRFNIEFTKEAWQVTLVRWNIVALCIMEGFPLDAIYGSLSGFFSQGFVLANLNLN